MQRMTRCGEPLHRTSRLRAAGPKLRVPSCCGASCIPRSRASLTLRSTSRPDGSFRMQQAGLLLEPKERHQRFEQSAPPGTTIGRKQRWKICKPNIAETKWELHAPGCARQFSPPDQLPSQFCE